MNSPITPRRGFLAWLWQRPRRWYLFGIPAGALLAFIIGIGVTAGSLGAIEFTSSEAFCVGCHEMRTPMAELKFSSHYSNAFGVRAACAECHIPPTFVAGLRRHMKLSLIDAWDHMNSELSTPEKYEAHRLAMAQGIWKELQGNDSAECRSCHTPAAMAFGKQPAAAASAHQSLATSGMTCIDCHKGVAHTLPQAG